MSFNERQLRLMYLAGTVPIPLTFPELGTITLVDVAGRGPSTQEPPRTLVRIEHRISPKLTIARSVPADEVGAAFFPWDPANVDYDRGDWLLAADVVCGLHERINGNGHGVRGIVYVREHAPVLMQVEVGMTAAESVEYYPPLTGDRSVNHYNLAPHAACARADWACAAGQRRESFCE